MNERDALRKAVCDSPSDDLPRLAYADWIEERGETERAEAIRRAIAAANAAPWEPLAVRERLRPVSEPDVAYAFDLRDFDDVEPYEWTYWAPNERAMRRGFGYGVRTDYVPHLMWHLRRIGAIEPIGHLELPSNSSDVDHWLALADMPELGRIESIAFHTLPMPIDPLRVLRMAKHSAGIRRIEFPRGDSPAFPVILRDLFESPLGDRIESLGVASINPEDSPEVLEILASHRTSVPMREVRFSRVPMVRSSPARMSDLTGISHAELIELRDCGLSITWLQSFVSIAANASSLDLANNRLPSDIVRDLGLADCAPKLRHLELSGNPIGDPGAMLLSLASRLSGLRSLGLAWTRCSDLGLKRLVRSQFWPNLVRLDLRDNPIAHRGISILAKARCPRDITALFISRRSVDDTGEAKLRDRYGSALILD